MFSPVVHKTRVRDILWLHNSATKHPFFLHMVHSLIIISEALVLPDVLKKNYSKHGGVNLINALKPTWTLWKKASKRRPLRN